MVLVAPRKGKKRAAQTIDKGGPKAPKQAKKKDEIVVNPDLRPFPSGGIVLSFGQGDVGQLGLGEDVMEKSRPAAIAKCNNVIAIAAGGMHSICLTKDGKVLTFGCNDEGALGRDTSKEGSETIPDFVDLPENVIQVTAGDSHSAALLESGKVYAWGSFRDSHGTMGLTLKGNEKLPIELLSGTKIVKIASGADHLVLLDSHGNVYTCGCGEQGQLGRVTSRTADRFSRQGIAVLLTPNPIHLKVTKKLKFNDIWAGTYCTFVKECHNDDIYVFGLNNYHQIGLEETITHFYPQLSQTFSGKKWNQISSGQHHTIALDDNGQVYTMGRKEYGRLGLGPNCSDAKELTLISTLSSSRCIDVAAGAAQSFAVTDKGELYSWGMGTNGQLGTGGDDDIDTPVKVKGKQLEDKTVVRVSGGGQHTIILGASRVPKNEDASN